MNPIQLPMKPSLQLLCYNEIKITESGKCLLPWGVVYEGELSKIVAFLKCCYRSFPMDNDVDGTLL